MATIDDVTTLDGWGAGVIEAAAEGDVKTIGWFILWKAAAILMHSCQGIYHAAFRIEKRLCWLAVKSCTPHYDAKTRYNVARGVDEW